MSAAGSKQLLFLKNPQEQARSQSWLFWPYLH